MWYLKWNQKPLQIIEIASNRTYWKALAKQPKKATTHDAITHWVDYMFVSKPFSLTLCIISAVLDSTHEGQPSLPEGSVLTLLFRFLFLSHRKLIALGGTGVKHNARVLINTSHWLRPRLLFRWKIRFLLSPNVSFKFQFSFITFIITIVNARWHCDFGNHLHLSRPFNRPNRRYGRHARFRNRYPLIT